MDQVWRIKYQRVDGAEFLSSGLPYADQQSADAIAAIGRVTGPSIGIVACDAVQVLPSNANMNGLAPKGD